MLKAKVILAALAVPLALGAFGSASASAETATKMAWYVSGTISTKGETAAVASPATLDSPAVFNAPKLTLKITCSKYSTTNAEIFGGEEEKGQVESAKFEDCSEIAPSTCKLEMPTIASGTLELLLRLFSPPEQAGPHLLKDVHALTGSTIAVITFEGSGCPIAGERALTGSFLEAASLATEETSHAIEGLGTFENNSLELAGQKVYLEGGKTLLKLSSGSQWSFKAI